MKRASYKSTERKKPQCFKNATNSSCAHIVSYVRKDVEQLERLQMNVRRVTYEKKVKEIDLFR